MRPRFESLANDQLGLPIHGQCCSQGWQQRYPCTSTESLPWLARRGNQCSSCIITKRAISLPGFPKTHQITWCQVQRNPPRVCRGERGERSDRTPPSLTRVPAIFHPGRGDTMHIERSHSTSSLLNSWLDPCNRDLRTGGDHHGR